jgi:predicted esterase
MRILCLHGLQQSGEVMRAETEFLKQVFDSILGNTNTQLVYPTAPWPMDEPEVGGESSTFSWWPMNGNENDAIITAGFLSELLDTEGPFDGVVGFSQGAMVSGLMAALLEQPQAKRLPGFMTSHAPFKFVISYSGYREEQPRLDYLYKPRSIKTPIIHFVSASDPVVTGERCMSLVEACADSEDRVIEYPGSGFHRVPRTKSTRSALIHFLEELLFKRAGRRCSHREPEVMCCFDQFGLVAA